MFKLDNRKEDYQYFVNDVYVVGFNAKCNDVIKKETDIHHETCDIIKAFYNNIANV